ncbi:MAG: hypothetical protein WCA00_17830 [Candidatus Acidiferrales bacterium]
MNSRISGAKQALIFGTASRAKGDPANVRQTRQGTPRGTLLKRPGLDKVIKKPPKRMWMKNTENSWKNDLLFYKSLQSRMTIRGREPRTNRGIAASGD